MPSILITGVSTGIGRACVERFAREGWEVIGTVRDVERASAQEWPSGARLEELDLDCAGCGASFGEAILERHGCPDVLLNNAGMVQFGPIEHATPEQIAQIYRVNVFEQIALAMALVPAMRERGDGLILNVTSLGGRMTFPFFAVYNSTKHALEGLSEGLWHELKPFGIRVKAIEPGFVETAVWGKVLGDNVPEPPPEYAQYMRSMEEFEEGITKRTSPADAADEIWHAALDPSDRLRYPIAAYARPILRARRVLGDMALMRFFHKRWLG